MQPGFVMLPGRTLKGGYFRIAIIVIDIIPAGGIEGADDIGALVRAVGREWLAGVGVDGQLDGSAVVAGVHEAIMANCRLMGKGFGALGSWTDRTLCLLTAYIC